MNIKVIQVYGWTLMYAYALIWRKKKGIWNMEPDSIDSFVAFGPIPVTH